MWWVSQPSRARHEWHAIAELEARSPWLSGVTWDFDKDFQLAANFTIRHLDQEFLLRIIYPPFFPDTPPQVFPRQKILLSAHQWGIGGELCLEYRPDNWDPSFTGAMMIESAYRLLSGERPADGSPSAVPSAHALTRAQSARGAFARFLVTAEAREVFQRHLLVGQTVELALLEHYRDHNYLAYPIRLGPKDNPLWVQRSPVPDIREQEGFAIRLPSSIEFPVRFQELHALLRQLAVRPALERIENKSWFFVLLANDSSVKLLHIFWSPDGGAALPYTTIDLPNPMQRLSDAYAILNGKSVAIIGCGSLGSKVATSIARSGVNTFVLIDEDILYPDNLSRHDLDGFSVGLHKVDAVSTKLRAVNPQISVANHCIKLGGQESSARTDLAIREIAACDIIIDATANPQVFNLCGSAARRARKPFLWGEVFAGGIGGLIARSRPDIDPPPHVARRQIINWCDQRGIPWEPGPLIQYGVEAEDKAPLIADDADVSVIASHLARMAIDTLVYGPDSRFPHSAYVIGLAQGWVFSEPFDTRPITYSAEGSWGPDQDPDHKEQFEALVAELFPFLSQADAH